jgi:hypothetical protein
MPNVAQLFRELRASVTRFRLSRIDLTYIAASLERSQAVSPLP